MSYTINVGGKITITAKGSIKTYAKEDIVFNSQKSITLTGAENGVTFGEPEKFKLKTDLLITKVEGPFDDKGNLVKVIKKGVAYTYKATPSRKPDETEVKLLRWAGKNDDGKINELPGVSSHNVLSNDKIIIGITINTDCEKIRIYAYFKKPDEKLSVLVSLKENFPILILRGSRRKGKRLRTNETALDLLYGDYTEDNAGFEKLRQQLYNETYDVEKQDSFYNVTSRVDNAKNKSDKKIEKVKAFCKKSNDDLFEIFRNDIESFASGKIEAVAKEMVDKMKRNEGGEYTNTTLTNAVIDHENSKNFIASIKKVINEYIDRNKGNIDLLEITDDSNGLLYAQLVVDKVDNPRFSDKISGLGITINDVWAYDVFITDYKINGNNFSMKLNYIYWDHFGLDFPDIEKYDNDIFYSWFILQHFRGFKPFITKLAIIGELNGTF